MSKLIEINTMPVNANEALKALEEQAPEVLREWMIKADKDGYDEGMADGYNDGYGAGLLVQTEQHPRPWGYYEVLAEGPGYKVKRLVVNPGQRTSLQWHEKRDETWVTVRGFGELTLHEILGTEPFEYLWTDTRPGEVERIPATDIHRIANTGTEPLVIIEVQTFDADDPSGEDDVHRIEDDYNREVE